MNTVEFEIESAQRAALFNRGWLQLNDPVHYFEDYLAKTLSEPPKNDKKRTFVTASCVCIFRVCLTTA